MMAAKDLGKVAVLMGGKSSEREVSISSGTGGAECAPLPGRER